MIRVSKTLVVIVAILSVLSIVGVATENTDSVSDNIVKLSIKSKSLGSDKNFNVDKVLINISINKLGHLAYIENYYTEGSEGLKFYSSSRYYDTNMTNNSISFEMSRPKSKSGKTYSYIKSIILLDNKIVFEQLFNSSSFRLSYSNMPSYIKIKNNTISKYGSNTKTLSGRSYLEKNSSKAIKTNETGNKLKSTWTENMGIPLGFGIITIVMISVFYAFRRKKINK